MPETHDFLPALSCVEPALVQLSRHERGHLVLSLGSDGRPIEKVRVARCCPWSAPQQFLSILDSEGREVALLRSLDGLDPSTRRLLEEELAAQEFLPRITAVESVDDRFDVMVWKVQTDHGPIELQIEHAEDIRWLDDGRVLLKDHAGSIFLVSDIMALDLRSRRLIEDRLA